MLGDGWRLEGATLAVTVEPCTMCAGALVLARVARVVFGAWEPKTGAVGSLWDVVRDRRLNHRPAVRGGVLAASAPHRWRSSSPASDWGEQAVGSVSSLTVACPSGLRSTPRKRVTAKTVRGFKSLRHRQSSPPVRAGEELFRLLAPSGEPLFGHILPTLCREYRA